MFVIVCYDISNETKEGRKRLSKVAKVCLAYGQRIQNSLYECLIDYSQYKCLKTELSKIIDNNKDTIRFYLLGNDYKRKIENIGKNENIFIEDTLIL